MRPLAQQRVFIILLLLACAMLAPAKSASAREAKVLICPFEGNSNEDVSHIQSGIAALLPARVAVTKKITVIDTEAQRPVQPQQGKSIPLSEKLAQAKKLGADYLVTGSITKLGSAISIDAMIADVQRSREPVPVFIQCASLDSLIPEISKLGQTIKQTIEENPAFAAYEPPAPPPAPSRPAPVSGALAAENTGRTKSRAAAAEQPEDVEPPARRSRTNKALEERYIDDPAPMGARNKPGALFASAPVMAEYIRAVPMSCLAAGDVNGDGIKELLVSGGDEIHILRFDGRTLAPIEEIKAAAGARIVHIDTANLNGKGPDEIYVTSFDGRSANSYVLEYKNNEYGSIQNGQPWFFRTVTLPDGKPALLGQDARFNNPFGGDIYSLACDNGTLRAGEKYKIPGGLNVYGFTGADSFGADRLGADIKYLAFTSSMFSPEYSLKIKNAAGKDIWRDTQLALGGTANYFKKFMFADQTEVKEPVPLRIICPPVQPGGKPCIIVGRNVKKGQNLLKQLMNYTQGEVLCLVWGGTGFDVNWRSGYFRNYVADYILEDIDNDGVKELCILSSTGGEAADRAVNKIAIYRQAAF